MITAIASCSSPYSSRTRCCNRILEMLKLKEPAVQSSGKAWRAVGLVNRAVSLAIPVRIQEVRILWLLHGAFPVRFEESYAGFQVNQPWSILSMKYCSPRPAWACSPKRSTGCMKACRSWALVSHGKTPCAHLPGKCELAFSACTGRAWKALTRSI